MMDSGCARVHVIDNDVEGVRTRGERSAWIEKSSETRGAKFSMERHRCERWNRSVVGARSATVDV